MNLIKVSLYESTIFPVDEESSLEVEHVTQSENRINCTIAKG